MSWWNIIKQDWELYAMKFQMQLSTEGLTSYRIHSLNQEEENYFKEILGKTPEFHYLLITPHNASIGVNETSEEVINDVREAVLGMRGMDNLSNKEKLDLVRLRPNIYSLIEYDGGFSNPSQLKYVMGNKLVFDLTVVAMKDSIQEVEDNKKESGFIP